MSTMTSVAGAVAGAGLMYVLDPVAGSRRRALARDQIRHARRRVTEATGVFLDGVVASEEVAHAVRRIRGMHGVDRVENRLELRADPAELPGAQSPIPDLPRDPRLDLTCRRWSPSERAEGVALGGGLLLDGVRRGGLSGAALGIAGMLVLFRTLTNEPLAERFARRDRRERAGNQTALPAATEPTRPPLWSRA